MALSRPEESDHLGSQGNATLPLSQIINSLNPKVNNKKNKEREMKSDPALCLFLEGRCFV
jgi:hypothetical protein